MALEYPPPALVNSPWRPVIVAYLQRLVPSIPRDVTLTNWHRDPATNRRVGGAPESQHLFSLATDWVGPGVGELRRRARANGLVAVREVDHLHVQAFPRGTLAAVGVRFPT